MNCVNCHTPLTGGLDTYGDVNAPKCFLCHNAIGHLFDLAENLHDAIYQSDRVRFVPDSTQELLSSAFAIQVRIENPETKEITHSDREVVKAKNRLEEGHYWRDYWRDMAARGLCAGVTY